MTQSSSSPKPDKQAKLPSAEFAPGNVLAGKYRIDQVLGAGGMGVILGGRHVDLDQRVAIKALRKESLDDAELVARFLREARASAKLKSEHVARVIDVGRHGADQVPFIVMEFLHGSDLSELQKANGPLPIPLAVEYVLQACEAIAEAHALGIIHRDLKPANLFLTKRPDGSALVKVLDFGISKMVDSVDIATGSDPLTKTAMMMGSPHYMPPEQLRSARDVDQRADIWSLGVVLHRLLTGEHAFDAPTTPELCVAILVGSPRPLRSLLPTAPERLEEVILHCLQKETWARFANVAELARALEPFAPPRARVSIDRIISMQVNGRSGSVPPLATRAEGETSVDVPVPMGGHEMSTMAASVASTEAARRNAGLPRSRGPALLVAAGALLVLGAVGFVVGPRVMPALARVTAAKDKSANATAASDATQAVIAETTHAPVLAPLPVPATATPVSPVALGAASPASPTASSQPHVAVALAPRAGAKGPPATAAAVKGPASVEAPPTPPPVAATPPSDPNGFGDRK